MAALDTNILVRLLIGDDAAQLEATRALIRGSAARGESLYVPISVTLELEWVLRSVFKLDKLRILLTFSQLLSTVELRFESEHAIEIALAEYAGGNADYSDCLHAALAIQAGETPLWTFDRAASKVRGAALLSARPAP